MSEYLELDPSDYDREIGAEAAFALNGLVTLRRQGSSENQAEQWDMLAERLEETVDRHIGRRPENDRLFVGTGMPEITPILRAPWNMAAEEALLSDAMLEKQAQHTAKLANRVYTLVEPYYTGFLDKLPQKPAKHWYKKTLKPTTWSEQGTYLGYEFEITPDQDSSFGFSTVTCNNIRANREFGVRGTLRAQEGKLVQASISWMNHMDYGDAPQIIEYRAPGLWNTIKEQGFAYGWNSRITINFDEMSLILHSPDSYSDVVSFRYDADKNSFINHSDGRVISPSEFLKITEQILSFVPTVTDDNRGKW